jgi:hypothetical protein
VGNTIISIFLFIILPERCATGFFVIGQAVIHTTINFDVVNDDFKTAGRLWKGLSNFWKRFWTFIISLVFFLIYRLWPFFNKIGEGFSKYTRRMEENPVRRL